MILQKEIPSQTMTETEVHNNKKQYCTKVYRPYLISDFKEKHWFVDKNKISKNKMIKIFDMLK